MFETIADASLRASLEFIVKVDALKKVLRQTSVIKNERRENSAEHSWHLALMALVFKNYANTAVKLDRVIKMLLVHDLGEIQAGDIHLYDSSRSEAQDSERLIVERLFSQLPQDLREELTSLWIEFAEGKTPEACYARAMDRFEPFLSNLANDGGSWNTLKVTKDKALAKNRHIAEGSEKLWQVYETLAEEIEERGHFYDPS